MQKNKKIIFVCSAFAFCFPALSGAVTLEEMGEKNRTYMALKADLEIAKTRSDLNKVLTGKSDKKEDQDKEKDLNQKINEVVAAPKIKAKVVKKVEEQIKPALPMPIESQLSVKAISGSLSSPTVEFTYQGTAIPPMKIGSSVIDGWVMVGVRDRAVTIKRAEKDGEVIKTLYLRP